MLSISGFAQDTDITSYPGYIDLSEINIPESAGKATEITIGPSLIKMVSQLAEEGDNNIDINLTGCVSIQVKTFDIDSIVSEEIRPAIERIEMKLQKENWKQIIRVKEGNELTNISMLFDEDKNKTLGMLIMCLEPDDEASFINIVGDIDLNKLGNIGKCLDGSTLDSLKKILEK
jgi:hypothetical protein